MIGLLILKSGSPGSKRHCRRNKPETLSWKSAFRRLKYIKHNALEAVGSGLGAVFWSLAVSISLGLVIPYPLLVFINHQDVVFALVLTLGFTILLFVAMFGVCWQIALDYQELQERSDRRKGANP
jgi:hypothetical protein